MRSVKSLCGESPAAEVVRQAIAAQFRAQYDAPQPPPGEIEALLRRLMSQESDREVKMPPSGLP